MASRRNQDTVCGVPNPARLAHTAWTLSQATTCAPEEGVSCACRCQACTKAAQASTLWHYCAPFDTQALQGGTAGSYIESSPWPRAGKQVCNKAIART